MVGTTTEADEVVVGGGGGAGGGSGRVAVADSLLDTSVIMGEAVDGGVGMGGRMGARPQLAWGRRGTLPPPGAAAS